MTLTDRRSNTGARLQALATRLEELPLDAAAEVLVLLEPALAALEREAALAVGALNVVHPGPPGAEGSYPYESLTTGGSPECRSIVTQRPPRRGERCA
jgi:hypothetical protein